MIENLRVLIAVISEYLGVPDEIVVAVIIVIAVLTPLFSWLLWDGKKQIELEVSNFNIYSEDGVSWEGESIPIDSTNNICNILGDLTFFHPITGKGYSCSDTREAPEGKKMSYIETEYSLVEGRVEVNRIAYIVVAPHHDGMRRG